MRTLSDTTSTSPVSGIERTDGNWAEVRENVPEAIICSALPLPMPPASSTTLIVDELPANQSKPEASLPPTAEPSVKGSSTTVVARSVEAKSAGMRAGVIRRSEVRIVGEFTEFETRGTRGRF